MKEKIKQVIINGTTVYLFTDNPKNDIKILENAYKKRDDIEFEFELGYEKPVLAEYEFLGKKYECISLWFDNEDVPDFFKSKLK